MKFGKMEDISGVDFRLEGIDERSLGVLCSRGGDSFQLYVGCPVWGNKAWVGKLYPEGVKQKQFLWHYSRLFNTIELNTTHYRVPTEGMVEGWRSQSGEAFRFCPKLPQEFSHWRRLSGVDDRIRLFADRISLFEDRLGCSFVQLPPNFTVNELDKIRHFAEVWPSYLPIAFEFRHESWFKDRMLIGQIRDLLEYYEMATVISDVAGRRDVSHGSLTNSIGMIRFVGNGLVESDFERLDAWVDEIGLWVEAGLEELYFFVHEPDDTYAPEIGVYLLERMNACLGLNMKVPILERQKRLF